MTSKHNTILKYDATNQTWAKVEEMAEKRVGHTVALMEEVSKPESNFASITWIGSL